MVDKIEKAVNGYNFKIFSLPHCYIHNLQMTWAYPAYVENLTSYGTKIYISANILNSLDIFHVAVPWLLFNKISFKIIPSNHLLKQVNDNLFGYLHSGKFITIFPSDCFELTKIMQLLDVMLGKYKSIPIPLKERFKDESIVYHDFKYSTSSNRCLGEEKKILGSGVIGRRKNVLKRGGLFLGKFILLEIVRQRARGGTYLALEILQDQMVCRKVFIKEARDFGEIELSGVDAVDRLHWQFKMLNFLNKYKITPKAFEIIKEKNVSFLAMEYLEGESLRKKIIENQGPFLNQFIRDTIIKIAKHIKKMHDKQMYFLELCPDNIMLLPGGDVKLIDCDLCYAKGAPEFVGWENGTPGFFPNLDLLKISGEEEKRWGLLRDIFALGSIYFSLLFPHSYKELFKGVKMEDSEKVKIELIRLLPENLQLFFKRAFLINGKFEKVSDFIDVIMRDKKILFNNK